MWEQRGSRWGSGVIDVSFRVAGRCFKGDFGGRSGLLLEDWSPYDFYLSSHGVVGSVPTDIFRVA